MSFDNNFLRLRPFLYITFDDMITLMALKSSWIRCGVVAYLDLNMFQPIVPDYEFECFGERYLLKASICHEGESAISGHYTAVCKRGETYYHLDDYQTNSEVEWGVSESRHDIDRALKDSYIIIYEKVIIIFVSLTFRLTALLTEHINDTKERGRSSKLCSKKIPQHFSMGTNNKIKDLGVTELFFNLQRQMF